MNLELLRKSSLRFFNRARRYLQHKTGHFTYGFKNCQRLYEDLNDKDQFAQAFTDERSRYLAHNAFVRWLLRWFTGYSTREALFIYHHIKRVADRMQLLKQYHWIEWYRDRCFVPEMSELANQTFLFERNSEALLVGQDELYNCFMDCHSHLRQAFTQEFAEQTPSCHEWGAQATETIQAYQAYVQQELDNASTKGVSLTRVPDIESSFDEQHLSRLYLDWDVHSLEMDMFYWSILLQVSLIRAEDHDADSNITVRIDEVLQHAKRYFKQYQARRYHPDKQQSITPDLDQTAQASITLFMNEAYHLMQSKSATWLAEIEAHANDDSLDLRQNYTFGAVDSVTKSYQKIYELAKNLRDIRRQVVLTKQPTTAIVPAIDAQTNQHDNAHFETEIADLGSQLQADNAALDARLDTLEAQVQSLLETPCANDSQADKSYSPRLFN